MILLQRRCWGACVLAAAVVLFFGFFAKDADARLFQFAPEDPNYDLALIIAAAQEAANDVAVGEKLELDERFAPEDFNLDQVGTLPTSPFYFLKNARRGVTNFFTFGSQNKAELRLQFAAEKLLELDALVESGQSDIEVIRRTLTGFREELGELERRAGEVSADGGEDPDKEAFRKSVMDALFKYKKSLGWLEHELPPDIAIEIEEAKEKSSGAFGVVFDLVPPEQAATELVEVLEQQKGSEFKHFKNLEVLKEIEAAAPDVAKPALRVAEENALARLQGELERLEQAKQAIFTDFLREVGGNEARHLEILGELEVRPLSENLRSALDRAKEETLTRTEARIRALPAAAREKFLGHLADGELDDLRVVKELELNVDPALQEDLAALKRRASEQFTRRLAIGSAGASTTDAFVAVERFHDVKSLSVLDDIEALVPEGERGIFAELKRRAIREMSADLSRARDEAQRELLFDAFAGDHPEQFAFVERFEDTFDDDLFSEDRELDAPLPDFFARLRDAQYDRVRDRIDEIQDSSRLSRYEDVFGRLSIRSDAPVADLEEFLREKKTLFSSPDRAAERIAEAEEFIAKLLGIADTLPLEVGRSDEGFDPVVREAARLLELAERRAESARAALQRGETGIAYADAREAVALAEHGIQLARSYKSGTRVIVEQRPDFLPDDFFIPRDYTPERTSEPEFTVSDIFLYNKYEFTQYCSYLSGIVTAPNVCKLPDGRVFDAATRAFPLRVPPEFVPQRVRPGLPPIGTPGSERPTATPQVCPYFFPPPQEYCLDGRITFEHTENGCPVSYRCDTGGDDRRQCPAPVTCPSGFYRDVLEKDPAGCPVFSECLAENLTCGGFQGLVCPKGYTCRLPRSGDDSMGTCVVSDIPPPGPICQAYFEGYTYDEFRHVCERHSTTGCEDPFVFHTRESCEQANGIRRPDEPRATSTIYRGDQYSCPGFSYSRYDARGERYCQLNDQRSCQYSYPEYLERVNYAPRYCPEVVPGPVPPPRSACRLYSTARECAVDPGCTWATENGVGVCRQFDYGAVCGDGVCGAGEYRDSCPRDCVTAGSCRNTPYYCVSEPECRSSGHYWCNNECFGAPCGPYRPNWVSHTWYFNDGMFETSQILARTDAEYLQYVSSVDAACRRIPRHQFTWRILAGDDRPENWQNFGIPDCSGLPSPVTVPFMPPPPTTSCDFDGVCESNENYASCASDCGGTGTTSTVQLCTDPRDCRGVDLCLKSGFYWCNGYCQEGSCPIDAIPPGCFDAPEYCTSDFSCRSGGWYWCNGACRKEYCPSTTVNTQPTGSCWTNPLLCSLENDCRIAGFYWCGGKCQKAYCAPTPPPAPTPTPTPTSTSTSATCSAYSTMASCNGNTACYWNTPPGTSPYCSVRWGCDGDGMCEANESASTCPGDCGGGTACNNNGICGPGESTYSCPADCTSGAVPQTVLNVLPGAHEHWNQSEVITYLGSNEDDFVVYNRNTSTITRQGKCSTDPSPPQGCSGGTTTTACNYNGYCDSSESMASCPADCGGSSTACNYNGTCDYGESSGSCPADCTGGSTGGGGSGSCIGQISQSVCLGAGSQCRWYNLINGTAYCDDEPHTPSQTSCDNSGTCDPSETAAFCPSDCSGTAASCTATNYSACTTEQTCASVGLFWCNGQCKSTQLACSCGNGVCEANESASICAADCTTMTCSYSSSYCTTESECTANNFYWCNGTCMSSSSACPSSGGGGSGCSSMPYTCTTESECTSHGYYWCNGECWSSSCSGSTTGGGGSYTCASTPSYCATQTDCTSSGYHWCASSSQCYGSSSSCPTAAVTPVQSFAAAIYTVFAPLFGLFGR